MKLEWTLGLWTYVKWHLINLIIFNLGKSQLEKVFDEVIQLHKDKYQEIIDISFKDPHDWILINLHKSRSIYRNFDKLIINDNEL